MNNSPEHLKLCAARYVWPRRSQMIMHKEPGERYRKRITWLQWWNIKFNADYDSYIAEQMSKRNDKASGRAVKTSC